MNRVKRKEALQKAKDTIFRLLKFRPRSEKEIRDRLNNKNFQKENIDGAIQYFKDLQLIDDRQFARNWISSRLQRPFGPNRIRFELKEKGIHADILQEELKSATSNFPEEEIVLALAKKRASLYKDIEKNKIEQRVYNYLVRRGFNNRAILKAIKQL